MDLLNLYNAIPLGVITGLAIAFFIGMPLLNHYLEKENG